MKKILALTAIASLCFLNTSAATEDVKVSTYYTSPYGYYIGLDSSATTRLATAGGNVGIGTTLPVANLHLYRAAQAGQSDGGLLNPNPRHAYVETNRVNGSPMISFRKTTLSSNTWFEYRMGIDGNSNNEFGVSFNPKWGSAWGNRAFMIQQGTPDYTTYLTSAGNVGIGTTAPNGKLDVSASGAGPGVVFNPPDSNNFGIQAYGGGINNLALQPTAGTVTIGYTSSAAALPNPTTTPGVSTVKLGVNGQIAMKDASGQVGVLRTSCNGANCYAVYS